ncbi:TetR/AcrR family transcriptional regulator [Sutcliffiella deserti]|uniref:TetR/AcrR family transcriptional regulator n=1 Tax=Sutcliffiella deserti TaxID=2875501 RepID=UPI001CBD4F30|nr:TetR/AcrR family transcriptional regulator [Sutcliffiella deserti]
MSLPTTGKIKKSALHLFAQKGYYGTSLNEVALLVGIKKPSLYAHYKNKDELYKTVIRDLIFIFKERVNLTKVEAFENNAKEQLFLIVEKMVNFWKEEDLGLLYKRSMLFPEEKFQDLIHEQFKESEEYTTKIINGIFAEAFQSGQIHPQPLKPLVDAFYCLVDGLFVQRFFYPSDQYNQKVIHAFNHYWNGIETGGKT